MDESHLLYLALQSVEPLAQRKLAWEIWPMRTNKAKIIILYYNELYKYIQFNCIA